MLKNIKTQNFSTTSPSREGRTVRLVEVTTQVAIEEGRAASKSPHKKFGYFLSMAQQFSWRYHSKSAVGIFSPKTEGTKTLSARIY
jgi:hypothetical protein